MKQINLRRSTDHGYIPPRRSTLQSLRRALGLVTVAESLRDLSHWRRMRASREQRVGS